MTIQKQKYEPTTGEKKVLDLIMKEKAVTQNQLADRTGMKQQYLSKLLKNLQEAGILRKGERIASGKPGQPRVRLELVPEFSYSFGISIMSDSISIAAVDFAGNVVFELQDQLMVMSRSSVLDFLNTTIDDFLAERAIQKSDISGLGVGITGYLVDKEPKFNPPAPLDDWALINIQEVFGEATGLPVHADNDGNMAVLGEDMLGAGRWADNFAYLFFSYGFGGGIINDGKLIRGAFGNAGEFAGAFPMHYYRMTLESLRQEVNSAGKNIKNVAELVRDFDENWPGVDEWVSRVKDQLSVLLKTISCFVDPNAIVLGGRIPKALAQRLIAETHIDDAQRRGIKPPRPNVISSESKGDVTAIGAATVAIRHNYFV